MTYKNMIKGIAGREAKKWVESFIKTESGLASCDDVELRIEDGICYFEAKIHVYGIKSPMNKYTVGGTICESGYVYNSVIYDWNKKTVWLSVEETRQTMGITELLEIA